MKRLGARVLVALAAMPLATAPAASAAQGQEHADHHGDQAASPGEWRMPPMPEGMFMLPGLESTRPGVSPILPGSGLNRAEVPEAVFREVVRMADGDTLELEATFVRRRIKDHEFIAYGFNGQYPGPLVWVDQHSTIVVRFRNGIDWPSTVHWHGVRVANRFDGVPGLTQDLVMPGETFVYEVTFPDAGLYWYHPHHREEITQGAGLYGNMLVDSPEEDYYGAAHRNEVIILDDLLFDEAGLFPFGEEAPTHALMGRFGNVLLVNGRPDYELAVKRGEVVRFHVTNASAARTYNLSFGDGVRMKLVASDLSRYERELWIGSLVLGPAERYVVEARFEEAGMRALVNDIQALDHVFGRFFRQVDTLARVTVAGEPAEPPLTEAFERLRRNEPVVEEIDAYRPLFDRPVDHALTLTVRAGRLPIPMLAVMEQDTIYFPPVEWNDAMPMMNWLSTGRNLRWILREDATGRENMDIRWAFGRGEVVKLRIFNDPESFHPMQHPIHLHGQRFLVLEQDGVKRTNLVWKDTAIIPTGSTVDLVVEMSNPGDWMLHCHISEHLGAGMMMAFTVHGDAAEGGR